MTSIKITFSDDDVVPQQVPKSQNASHMCSRSGENGDFISFAIFFNNDGHLEFSTRLNFTILKS